MVSERLEIKLKSHYFHDTFMVFLSVFTITVWKILVFRVPTFLKMTLEGINYDRTVIFGHISLFEVFCKM